MKIKTVVHKNGIFLLAFPYKGMICDTFYDSANQVYSKLDCDGDSYEDHACINTVDHEGWLVLSSEKCPLTWGSPQTKEDKCPQALGMIF